MLLFFAARARSAPLSLHSALFRMHHPEDFSPQTEAGDCRISRISLLARSSSLSTFHEIHATAPCIRSSLVLANEQLESNLAIKRIGFPARTVSCEGLVEERGTHVELPSRDTRNPATSKTS